MLIIFLIYAMAMSLFCNWLIDGIFKRCKDPNHFQQANNSLINIGCVCLGFIAGPVLLISFGCVVIRNQFSIENAFTYLVVSLEE